LAESSVASAVVETLVMETKFLFLVTGLAVAAATPAHAALVTCPASFIADGTAKVFNGSDTAVSACQYLTPPDPSHVASVANINASGFFGLSDWTDNGQTQVNLADGAGGSGSWTINGVDFDAYDYMMVFKDGAHTNLIAFLFNEEFASGSWSTPFTDPPFSFPGASTSRDVSHYSIVRRWNPDIEIPEPGMIGLLGLGLAGIAVRRRRA
jgi:hypothetical protein